MIYNHKNKITVDDQREIENFPVFHSIYQDITNLIKTLFFKFNI